MRSPADAYFYGIIDLAYVPDAMVLRVSQQLIEGGVDILQLRGKGRSIDDLGALAHEVLTLTMPANIPLIANDHAEIASLVEVQGVHVGQDDASVAQVRAAAGRPIIVGKSTHSLAQAAAAQNEGADYIGFGPIYPTPTKPEYAPIGLTNIRAAHEKVRLPIFCIGGVGVDKLPEMIASGARRVAIVSDMLKSASPKEYAQRAKELLVARTHAARDSFSATHNF